MMKKSTMFAAAGLLAGMAFLAGCGEQKPGVDDKTDIAIVKSALKKAGKSDNPERQIKYLRTAYVMAGKLNTDWPDSEKVPLFLSTSENELNTIPDRVFELAKASRDLESFKWAIARDAKVDLEYETLQKIWKMGKQWRDFYIADYPERSLPIFMSEAVNDKNQRFFDQYIEAFEASGYTLVFPLQASEFQPRFRLFIATMMKTAIKKNDYERVKSLLVHVPPKQAGEHVDSETEAVMRSLSGYAFHEVKDEAMACTLVELGYDTVRINLDKCGFGSDFARALLASPDSAVTNVLKLDQWHGPLTEKETRFLLMLPEQPLLLVHDLYLTDAIAAAVKKKDTRKAMRLLKIREERAPMKIHEYDQLLGLSIEYRNRTVYDYVKIKCDNIDIYTADLIDLGKSKNLFKMHAPKILKKIYPTMDTSPRPDGTTIGRIHQMLTHHCPDAALYVVSKYDLRDAWSKAEVEQTQLMAVCEGGNLEAAKYLIEKKRANVRAETRYSQASVTLFGDSYPEEGRLTPLFFAAKSGNSELLEYLIVKRRADVNAGSNFGATPLMYAVASNHPDAVQTLIRLGANVNATVTDATAIPSPDNRGYVLTAGESAYRITLQSGNTEIRTILKNAGAK